MSDRERRTQLTGPPQLVLLLATLLFGLSVLAALSLVSVQMARHYSRDAARRAIRQVFDEGIEAHGDVRYEVACRAAQPGGAPAVRCDPLVLKAGRSLRSALCRQEGFPDLLRNRWRCMATFDDGAKLGMTVLVRFGRRSLDLLLPMQQPGPRQPSPTAPS